MANTKKPRAKKKKPVGFSIETGVIEDFKEICEINNEIPSHVVQRLMAGYTKKES